MEPFQELFSENPRKVLILTTENCQSCTKSIDYLKYLGVEPVLENVDDQTGSDILYQLGKENEKLPRYANRLK